ncbi:MAG TPA: ACS family MFS transporter [Gemmatimonadaceae bacterium]|nr:ACS family MFS transporter [Gemmatimonadaceae bacterium]
MTTDPSAPSPRWPAAYTVVLLCFAAVFISYIDRTNISVAAIAMQEEFQWTETTKGFVLSSFFIGYILLQVVSAGLANRYGGRLLLGVAVVWWSAFTMLTPLAASLGLTALIASRIALGLGEAAVFPACINMVGRWVPTAQRSRAVALFSSGLSIGTVFSLPVTGWLVREYGWPVPFYAFGLVGFVWAVVWFRKVASGRGVPEEAAPGARAIPWGRILRTPAVWAIITNHFAHNWTLYVLLAWLPSYFKATFDVSLASAGLLSAAPPLATFLMANLAGNAADRLMRQGRSATYVRKLMQGLGLFGTAAFLLLVPLATSPTVGVMLMCAASGALGCCMAGFGVNSFDIAPRYADVIWGISNTAGTIPGIIGVAVTGWLVQRSGSYATAFVVTAGIAAAGAVVFLLIGTGERQID